MIEMVGFRLEALEREMLLDGGLSDDEYLQAFHLALGASVERPIFRDKTGCDYAWGRRRFCRAPSGNRR